MKSIHVISAEFGELRDDTSDKEFVTKEPSEHASIVAEYLRTILGEYGYRVILEDTWLKLNRFNEVYPKAQKIKAIYRGVTESYDGYVVFVLRNQTAESFLGFTTNGQKYAIVLTHCSCNGPIGFGCQSITNIKKAALHEVLHLVGLHVDSGHCLTNSCLMNEAIETSQELDVQAISNAPSSLREALCSEDFTTFLSLNRGQG